MTWEEMNQLFIDNGFAYDDHYNVIIDHLRFVDLYDAIAARVHSEIDQGNYRKGWIDGYSSSMRDEQRTINGGVITGGN